MINDLQVMRGGGARQLFISPTLLLRIAIIKEKLGLEQKLGEGGGLNSRQFKRINNNQQLTRNRPDPYDSECRIHRYNLKTTEL